MGLVFLSYASEDAVVARQVADAMRAAGVAVWIAPDSIEPGQAYNEAIVAGLKAADVLAVLVSRASNASKHVSREVGLADTHAKRIVPVRIEAVEPSDGLAYYLSLPQWVEWHTHGAAALAPLVAMLGGAAPPLEPVRTSPPTAPASGSATIQVQRGNALAYSGRKFAILLDGHKVAEVGNGASVSLTVEAGHHEIACRVDYIKSDPFPVHLAAGEGMVLQVSAAQLSNIGGQLSGLFGASSYFTWTRVS